MKRWVSLAILLGIVLFILWTAVKYWDFSKIGSSETIDLSGSIQSTDGRITFYPETMDVTYKGVYINIRYKIDENISRLGFEYNDYARFSLVENPSPKLKEENFYHFSNEKIYMQHIQNYVDVDENYLKVFFRYGDIQHLSEVNSYRLYLEFPGGFVKKTNEEYSVNMNDTKEITFDGLGTYQFRMYIQKIGEGYQLYITTRTFSYNGNPFTVHEKVIAIDGENTWTTMGGSGSGNGSRGSASWTFESKNDVNENFVNADKYQITIQFFNLDIEYSPFDAESNSVYLEL